MSHDEMPDGPGVVISEQYDPDGTEPITFHIVRLVSIAENREPTELRPLGEVIDAEALDRLVGHNAAPGHGGSLAVTFTYEGYEVDIAADGMVRLSLADV